MDARAVPLRGLDRRAEVLVAADERYPALQGRRGIYEEYERRVADDPAKGYAFAVEVMAGALDITEAQSRQLARVPRG